jgi:two-component system LytT family response regulator
MSKEIEKKFLLRGLPAGLSGGVKILQGYLSVGDPEVRVRAKGENYFLTRKDGAGFIREEEEYEIPKEVFEVLAGETENAGVEIVGESATGRAAVKAIQTMQPDLVFLDVQMPEMDGFQVLSALPAEQIPIVIFVTAYDRYALRAFEFHALDYLLKPFDRERFEQAFGRAKMTLLKERAGNLNDRIIALLDERRSVPAASQTSHPAQSLERIVIKDGGRVFFLRVEEIEWIEAEGNYVAVHMGSKSYLHRESISTLEARLDPRVFQGIHRSTIVNLDCVKELQPLFRGEYYVIMRDGTELKLSHSYRDKLLKQLDGLSS